MESNNKWSRICLSYDNYEGWLDNKQFLIISEDDYSSIEKLALKLSTNFVDIIISPEKELFSIMQMNHADVLIKIETDKVLNDATKSVIESAIKECSTLFLA